MYGDFQKKRCVLYLVPISLNSYDIILLGSLKVTGAAGDMEAASSKGARIGTNVNLIYLTSCPELTMAVFSTSIPADVLQMSKAMRCGLDIEANGTGHPWC